MNYTEMTDEALALMSDDLDRARLLNGGATFSNHPSHNFTGIDGRCMDCDCRRFGRHAPYPCI